MKTVAVYHSKGGVGKTTSCVNLAWTAAHRGNRVLLWDLDPQGGASFSLAKDQGLEGKARKYISGRSEWTREVLPTAWENLFLIPADRSLKDTELMMNEEKKSSRLLKEWVGQFGDDFDWVFLDCPPGLSLVADNIFRAADLILVPVIPSPLAVRSLGQVEEAAFRKEKWSQKIHPFLSMADLRKKIHRELGTYLLNREGSLKTVIPLLSEIERMGLEGKPAAVKEGSRSREVFESLWAEVCALNASN